MAIDYKFNEDNLIEELQKYVDSTYDQHYSKNKFQATEFIIDAGHGEGFCIGNITASALKALTDKIIIAKKPTISQLIKQVNNFIN